MEGGILSEKKGAVLIDWITLLSTFFELCVIKIAVKCHAKIAIVVENLFPFTNFVRKIV